jgi:NAD(P)-dependent dehydrogenase (short-subunit alcohol dehydrogenase family)
MYALSGQVGLVTGGGGGIGRAIARRLAHEGMAVAVLDRDEGAAQAAAAEIGGLGVTADVTEPEQVGRAVDTILGHLEKIDLLVNNAGVAWMGPALDTPLEALQAMLRVNIEGTFIVSRAVLPHMIARRMGSVVNLASWAGKTGPAYFAGYSASKFAVIGLTQSLAREMSPHGIRVNAICPASSSTRRCAARSRHNSGATDFPRLWSGKSRSRSGASPCLMTWRGSPPFSRRTNRPI